MNKYWYGKRNMQQNVFFKEFSSEFRREIMALRSDVERSLQVFKELKGNALPTNSEVIQH